MMRTSDHTCFPPRVFSRRFSGANDFFSSAFRLEESSKMEPIKVTIIVRDTRPIPIPQAVLRFHVLVLLRSCQQLASHYLCAQLLCHSLIMFPVDSIDRCFPNTVFPESSSAFVRLKLCQLPTSSHWKVASITTTCS